MNRLVHSPLRKSLSYAVFALGLVLIGLALSVSAYAQQAPAQGLPCSDDNNPQTTLAGCIYYIPETVASSRRAEQQATQNNSIEIQYYQIPDGHYEALEMPYYIRVVDHRRGRNTEIGHMNSQELENTQAELAVVYNNFYAAAMTGHGDGLSFQYMPSIPALGGTIATSSVLVLAIKTLTKHELVTGSSIFVQATLGRLVDRFRRRGNAAIANPTRAAAGITVGTAFSIFLAYFVEVRIYNFYKSLANERNWYDPAAVYAAFLREQLMSTSRCLMDESSCRQMVVSAQASSLIAHASAPTTDTADTLETIAQQLNGQQEVVNAVSAAEGTAEPAVPAAPVTRPAIRVFDMQHVADSYAALFREPSGANIGSDAGFMRRNRQVLPVGTRPRL